MQLVSDMIRKLMTFQVICICDEQFDVNHAMICMKGEFVVQRHYMLRHLEAELLNLVCKDVETESVLQNIVGEYWVTICLL